MKLLLILAATAAALFCAAEGKLVIGKHYSSRQGGDRTATVSGPTRLSAIKFDNDISRYSIVGKETWAFYDGPNFDKLLFTATGPKAFTGVPRQFNDKVSSVSMSRLSIGRHYSSRQAGDKTASMAASTKLRDLKFDNDMSRYRIDGKGTWAFYDGPDFNGKVLMVVTGPKGWTGVPKHINDKVSSVKLVKMN